MNRLYTLYLQFPKPKKIGVGTLSIGQDSIAHFFTSELPPTTTKLLADMVRVRIDFAGADGIMLSGMEQVGVDKTGRKKFRLQEWWLAYTTENLGRSMYLRVPGTVGNRTLRSLNPKP